MDDKWSSSSMDIQTDRVTSQSIQSSSYQAKQIHLERIHLPTNLKNKPRDTQYRVGGQNYTSESVLGRIGRDRFKLFRVWWLIGFDLIDWLIDWLADWLVSVYCSRWREVGKNIRNMKKASCHSDIKVYSKLTKYGARSSVGTFFHSLAICLALSLHSRSH